MRCRRISDFTTFSVEVRSLIASIGHRSVAYCLVDVVTEYTVENAVFSCKKMVTSQNTKFLSRTMYVTLKRQTSERGNKNKKKSATKEMVTKETSLGTYNKRVEILAPTLVCLFFILEQGTVLIQPAYYDSSSV